MVAVVALAAALGVGAAMLSSSRHEQKAPATTPNRSERVGPEILHFMSTATGSAYVDNAGKGFSAGDLLTEHTVLSTGGKHVGSMALTSTVTDRTGKDTGEVMFTAVADIRGSQLVMTGEFAVVPQNQTFHAAITGGTGSFAGATGTAIFKQVSSNGTVLTLTVTR